MTSGTVYIMDIDDTIVLHTKGKHDLYNMNSDTELLELISGLNYQKLYLYTNGTYGHGYNVSSNLQLNELVPLSFRSISKYAFLFFNFISFLI